MSSWNAAMTTPTPASSNGRPGPIARNSLLGRLTPFSDPSESTDLSITLVEVRDPSECRTLRCYPLPSVTLQSPLDEFHGRVDRSDEKQEPRPRDGHSDDGDSGG